MGVATILAARSIVILATGAHKAEAVARALTGPMTAELPASLLQSVADQVTWVLDEPAAQGTLIDLHHAPAPGRPTTSRAWPRSLWVAMALTALM